ncbi:uridine kinase family protein [Actinoallomurus iriomotensis]|uniref:Phosphoribulokinase/uridine kinase domain-containing protein n=1 Tax=Actinoallomurus iriomotensis TaxID=478107 RepID=A0A9W6VRU9_9ACTN|nr:hypothetical protein [Actinoallomurus iriomotensis]GLY78020.1 hypothetical protein Airi01_062870 [Actinoallomurus iriomotensis]
MSSAQRLVAISGLPGSGKSVLAEALGRTLAVPVVGMDAYYRPAPPGGWVDFSDPANLDVDVVLEQIDRHRAAGTELVIAEGIFALTLDAVRSKADLKVWLEIPMDIGLARKMLRKLEAGADIAPSIRGYLERGRAGYLDHVLPGRDHADLCLEGTRTVDDLVTEMAGRVLR